MPENSTILGKQPGGWTLIMLLVVMAIIAILMMYYLPSIFQVYRPPSSPDQEGTRKPTSKHIQDELAPIEQRNKQIDDLINQSADKDQEQSEEDQEADGEE